MANVFEQGESQEDLIPAVGRLARKIDQELSAAPRTASAAPDSSTAPTALSIPSAQPSAPVVV